MSDSVLFNGTADGFSYGTPGLTFTPEGAHSIVCIAKFDNTGDSLQTILAPGQASGGSPRFFQFNMAQLSLLDNAGTESKLTGLTIPNNTWVLCGVTKAAGSATPRFHFYDYTTWTHAAGDAALLNSLVPTGIQIASVTSEMVKGDILIIGMWNSVLSDATIETLPCSYNNWKTASVVNGLRFNSTTVPENFAGSLNAPTVNGSPTLDVGDVPVCWIDNGVVPGPGDAPPIGLLGRGAGW
jgi:hypothetical protein